jgi:hypothetical protein
MGEKMKSSKAGLSVSDTQFTGRMRELHANWVREGLVVPTSTLAKQWERSRQALDRACARGELFAVKVGKNRYYPAAFLQLDANAVKLVNLALKGDDSTAKFVFWTQSHGGLGARTIAEALHEGLIERAIELAAGWSEERGYKGVAPA